jgi:hypothetical protein
LLRDLRCGCTEHLVRPRSPASARASPQGRLDAIALAAGAPGLARRTSTRTDPVSDQERLVGSAPRAPRSIYRLRHTSAVLPDGPRTSAGPCRLCGPTARARRRAHGRIGRNRRGRRVFHLTCAVSSP